MHIRQSPSLDIKDLSDPIIGMPSRISMRMESTLRSPMGHSEPSSIVHPSDSYYGADGSWHDFVCSPLEGHSICRRV